MNNDIESMSYMRASDQQQISSDSDDYLTVEVIIFFCSKVREMRNDREVFFPFLEKDPST